VWPDTTSWDSESAEVQFKRLDADPITLPLEEPIQLGGATMVGEGPPGLAIPDACREYDEAFIVSEVELG
jgi:hypothetical protein